jgi:hypothetical protein
MSMIEGKEITAARQALADAMYGNVLATGMIGTRRVKIYDRGFVQVGWSGTPARIRSITSNIHTSKKSGVGRAAANTAIFVGTFGVGSNVTPNIRGDVRLTIVTDDGVKTLHTSSPTQSDVTAAIELEAAAQAALELAAQNPANPDEVARLESELQAAIAAAEQARRDEQAARAAAKAQRKAAKAERKLRKAADRRPSRTVATTNDAGPYGVEYKVGDIVNNHRLMHDGTQYCWVPLA